MTKISGIVCLVFTFILGFGAMACVSSPGGGKAPDKTPTIKAINDHPATYAGTTVRLSGRFKGWAGACQEGPPKTRSDWMVEDDTGCIYVTGSVPRGLQPMSPDDEPIDVTAVVRLTKFGKPYLEAQGP